MNSQHPHTNIHEKWLFSYLKLPKLFQLIFHWFVPLLPPPSHFFVSFPLPRNSSNLTILRRLLLLQINISFPYRWAIAAQSWKWLFISHEDSLIVCVCVCMKERERKREQEHFVRIRTEFDNSSRWISGKISACYRERIYIHIPIDYMCLEYFIPLSYFVWRIKASDRLAARLFIQIAYNFV